MLVNYILGFETGIRQVYKKLASLFVFTEQFTTLTWSFNSMFEYSVLRENACYTWTVKWYINEIISHNYWTVMCCHRMKLYLKTKNIIHCAIQNLYQYIYMCAFWSTYKDRQMLISKYTGLHWNDTYLKLNTNQFLFHRPIYNTSITSLTDN